MNDPLNHAIVSEGLRWGAILSVCALALAALGLAPGLSWIPEVPLLAAAILIPAGLLGYAGFRAASRSDRLVGGPLAGALAGAIGGGVAGITYLLVGKPAQNIVLGALAGAFFGAALGLTGGLLRWSRSRR